MVRQLRRRAATGRASPSFGSDQRRSVRDAPRTPARPTPPAPAPLYLHPILDEAALRRVSGGQAVVRERTEHLIATADLPHAIIQLPRLDLGTTSAWPTRSACWPSTTAALNTIVYVDSPAGNL